MFPNSSIQFNYKLSIFQHRLASNLLPYISLIQDFLDDDAYLMRNSILHIYGEIIINVLNQEATSKDLKLKQMRNELLDTLSEHLMDVHSMCRSRTLQIWKRIYEEKAMPLNYMNQLMKKCTERMEDSAASVRKNAFQLLCDLIRKNPYGIISIDTSLGEVETECAKEEAVLQKMIEEGLYEEILNLALFCGVFKGNQKKCRPVKLYYVANTTSFSYG